MNDERTGAPQVLNAEVLAQYEGLAPGFSAELIALFERDVPARLDLLRAAVVAEDWNAVAQVAHTLKGSSGNLGAVALAEACAALNTGAVAGDQPRVVALAREVEDAWDDVREALADRASPAVGGDGQAPW